MTAEELSEYIKEKAISFGAKFESAPRSPKNAVFRGDSIKADPPFIGIIRPEENMSNRYRDISLVAFPSKDDNETEVLISLTVGTEGYKNDIEYATIPYLRRLFLPLIIDDKSCCKTQFIDIEHHLDQLSKIAKSYNGFTKVLSNYGDFVLAASLLDSTKDEDLKRLDAWIANYAEFRNWATNDKFRGNIQNALNGFNPEKKTDVLTEVKNLITKHRYVVLQGAPGTGKTYTAVNRIAKEYKHVFIEQFHAETTHSDFVYGLTPDLSSTANGVMFVEKKGILLQAIERAIEDKNERVLLIIDEINRANLSNVLGEVFFLFEKDVKRTIPINVGGIKLTKLPDNLYVIATMNTADRSLAVVDFALRRRFAWYTLRPQKLNKKDLNEGEQFFDKYFTEFDNIFAKYATDDELNLQPGHSYFIAENEADMRDKIIYGLMPLIKEYLNQGYLVKARDAFANLFQRLVQKQLFE